MTNRTRTSNNPAYLVLTALAISLGGACTDKRDDTPGETYVGGVLPSGAIDVDGDGSMDNVTSGDKSNLWDSNIELDDSNVGQEDVLKTNCDESQIKEADAVLSGTVYAPNGELPISGAVVYTLDHFDGDLMTIPDEVYCPDCVELPCNAHHVLTRPDGTFELPSPSGEDQFLVVQKGQFLRVSKYDIEAGSSEVNEFYTTLPDHRDEDAGMYIPNMAVALGGFDRLENALAKFGLGDLEADVLVPGSEEFDLWDNYDSAFFTDMPNLTVEDSLEALLHSPDDLAKYHILFTPCTFSEFTDQTFAGDAQAQENLRDWVAQGGKLYSADFGNDFLRFGFPQYQEMYLNSEGSADISLYEGFMSLGTILNDGLLAWLEALPEQFQEQVGRPSRNDLPEVEFSDQFTIVKDVHEVLVENADGDDVDLGHYVWVEGTNGNYNELENYETNQSPPEPLVDSGQVNPMTMTAQYGCGKIMYTTYHTSDGAYEGIDPQELILLYLILEIGVCLDEPELPVPLVL